VGAAARPRLAEASIGQPASHERALAATGGGPSYHGHVAEITTRAFDAGTIPEASAGEAGHLSHARCGRRHPLRGQGAQPQESRHELFPRHRLTAKTIALVNRIADIEVTLTSSETEALLLEQSLIKAHRPPYNVVLRDDKSYPYIYLTDDPEYPRLTFHRGAKRKNGRYFGPYPSAGAVRDSLNILPEALSHPAVRGHVLPQSQPSLPAVSDSALLAPCVRLIDKDEYAADVRHAVMFLEGRNQAILTEFKEAMDQAATVLDFERAARFRDQITQLRRVQEQQYVHTDAGDVDAFAVAQRSGIACVQGLFLRGGRLLGQRTWFPRNELAVTEGELLDAFLASTTSAAPTGSCRARCSAT